ncbi:MAG: deoxyribonuclease IV, partial [Actinomycetota bacterium]
IGADAAQVFIQSARTWKPTNHRPEDLAALRAARESGEVAYLVCHAIYFINLATDDPDLLEKSRTALRTTIDVANAIAADGVVLHVGSHKGRGLDATLPQIARELKAALKRLKGPWLLLENSAGAGGTIGRDPVELAAIIDAVDDPRLGLCIDTCHAWVSGVDMTDPDALDRLVRELDQRVGIERLRCLHVNDAQAACGSNRDRHANVGAAVAADGSYGSLESVKAVSDVIAPLAGTVTAVNDRVVESPELVNEDPYGDGWLIRVTLADPASVETLLDAAAYRALL